MVNILYFRYFAAFKCMICVLGRLLATLQRIPPILAGCPVRRPVLARVLRQGGRVQGGRAPARLAPALGHGSVLALITKLPLTLACNI